MPFADLDIFSIAFSKYIPPPCRSSIMRFLKDHEKKYPYYVKTTIPKILYEISGYYKTSKIYYIGYSRIPMNRVITNKRRESNNPLLSRLMKKGSQIDIKTIKVFPKGTKKIEILKAQSEMILEYRDKYDGLVCNLIDPYKRYVKNESLEASKYNVDVVCKALLK